eukprot:2760701-Karenia_brevis.AAC.1
MSHQECAMSVLSGDVLEQSISTMSVEELKAELRSLQAQMVALTTISKLNAEQHQAQSYKEEAPNSADLHIG